MYGVINNNGTYSSPAIAYDTFYDAGNTGDNISFVSDGTYWYYNAFASMSNPGFQTDQ
jgi:hypothetical protein